MQGLRTVAALLVAVYHIWANRISGGVDVFFVVAGFFLVASFLKRDTVGLVHVRDYYAAVARRVLPVAMLVIVASVAAWVFVLPDALWAGVARHAVASAFQVENFLLAAISTNYLQPSLASPFQQFWALSLQMQVYASLPLLLLGAGLAARVAGMSMRVVASAALGLVFAASLAYSIVRTADSQPQAYFETWTRLWEFAAGGLLAIWGSKLRLPRSLAAVLGWLSLIALLFMGIVLDVSRSFPGIAAMLPVLMAGGIIVCAQSGGQVLALRLKPIVAFGDYSFAFYLWHWPLLIAARYIFNTPKIPLLHGLGIILLAAVLAYFSTKFFEQPVRRSKWLADRPWRTLAIGVVAIVGTAGAGLAWYQVERVRLVEARQEVAQYLATAYPIEAGNFVPDLVLAPRDRPSVCRVPGVKGSAVARCSFGDKSASRTIAIVGGSHTDQYLPSIDAYGKARGYKIVVMTKGTCHFARNVGNSSCREWNRKALKAVVEMRPELVITNGTRTAITGGKETMLKGNRSVWKALEAAGIPVLAIRDNPRFKFDAPVCLAWNRGRPEGCSVPRSSALAAVSPFTADGLSNVTPADFSDLICDRDSCGASKDGLVVYRDEDHLTETFVLAHKDAMFDAIDRALASQPR